MKISRLFFAAMALLTVSACVDTPEPPYDLPTGGDNGNTVEGVYIDETFAKDFGVFTPVETVGNYPWTIDYSTAKATSYIDNKNNAATSWIISNPVDFTEETEAYVYFEYIIRYSESGKVANNHQLLISADYSGDATKATWTDIAYNAAEGSDWNTFYKANVAVPAEFMAKSGIVFALRYTATTKSSTWEVKNFKVAHGTPEDNNTDTPSETGEYTVAGAMAAFNGMAMPAKVKGYIVGAIDGKSITDNAVLSGTVTLNTNILIADNADETDIDKCMPVQLPSGAVRNALNLVNNPGNYKKEVVLTGSLEKYFGVTGLKNVTAYVLDGVSSEPETPENPEQPANAYISETFSSSFGLFSTQETVGNFPWVIEYQTAKATSYVNETNNAATSWLVSPAVDFTSETEAYIAFEYIIRYAESGKVAANHQLLISSDYSGDVATATWLDIYYNATEGSDWNTFYKANVAVPTQFMGKNNVVIALCYKATSEKAGTWEVKNFIVAPGKASEETPDTTPDVPAEGGNFTVSQAIATYVDGQKIPATITGYIVGAMGSNPYKAEFSGTTSIASNILIADDANETDSTKCVIVQLSSGSAARTALNLVDNPGNYKKKVTITGSLEKYFNAPGLKSVTAYEIDGVSSKPDTPSEPDEPETPDTPSEPDTPDTPSTPEDQEGNYIANHSFENWSDSKPVSWGGTGHNATIEQSTDAHSGSYSALVKGNSSSNKRLASNSYTLPAGTYTLSAYLKQSGENAGQCRIGYVKLTNGAIESNSDYTYLTDAAAVSSDWSQVSAKMTFNETTEIAIIIMNNKAGKGAPILVDDVTLIAK